MSSDTTIILGAGIAGLSVADGLLQAGYPGDSILILEKYGYLGGRIVTGKRPDGTTYEIGAGRFHASHTRLIQLIHRFGLKHKIRALDGTTYWNSKTTTPNRFHDIWLAYLPLFRSLPKHILANSTLKEIAIQIFGAQHVEGIFAMHPYRSELEILRADLALESSIFLSSGYFYLEGGLHAIIERFAAHLRSKGVRIQMNTTVTNIRCSGSRYDIDVLSKTKAKTKAKTVADRVIAALHVEALRSLPVFKGCDMMRHVQMAPLTRIYAQFPTPWTQPRFVSDSLLRYTIPIQPQKGLVMISYTDARDTLPWKGLRGPPLEAKIMTEIRRALPDISVGKPTWVQSYEWKDGCSYWLPGDYDPREVSQAVIHPLPSYPELYVCGESFSMKQAWVEGALEHAAMLLCVLKRPQTTCANPVA